ncbi:MAG: hypothetical protein RLY70_3908 [Planctomycetota bacterium]
MGTTGDNVAWYDDILARYEVERALAKPGAHRSVECEMRLRDIADEPRSRSAAVARMASILAES